MLRSPDRLRPPPELRSDPAAQGARFLATCSRLLPRDQVIPETGYNQFPARAKTSSPLLCNHLRRPLRSDDRGRPCHECGATQASIWYGKRGEPKYCKKADCMRAGGYLALKKPKGARPPSVRAQARRPTRSRQRRSQSRSTLRWRRLSTYTVRGAPAPCHALPARA